jgi:hypothetical protein
MYGANVKLACIVAISVAVIGLPSQNAVRTNVASLAYSRSIELGAKAEDEPTSSYQELNRLA